MNTNPHSPILTSLLEQDECYVFIDRSVPFLLEDELQDHQVDFIVLDDPLFNETPNLAPILVHLKHAEHQDLLKALLQVAHDEASKPDILTRSVCAFLQSKQSLGGLAAPLKRQLDLQVTDFGGVYFRYFDPRVAPVLIPLLTPEQHWQWLHQIQTWLYFDWQGQIQTLPSPPASISKSAQSWLVDAKPTVSLAQWEAMDKIELHNKTIQALRQHGHVVNDALHKAIKKQLQFAAESGLKEANDQVTFAEYAIELNRPNAEARAAKEHVPFAMHEIPPDFELQHHPQFASGLELVNTHQVPLKDVLEDHMNLSIDSSRD